MLLALKKGYEAILVKDCSSSRNNENHNCAIELMKQLGCHIVTLEIVLFDSVLKYESSFKMMWLFLSTSWHLNK